MTLAQLAGPALVLLLAGCSAPTTVQERARVSSASGPRAVPAKDSDLAVELLLGVGELDEDQLEPAESLITGGLRVRRPIVGRSIHAVADLSFGFDDGDAIDSAGDPVDVETNVSELGLGLMAIYGHSRTRLQPYAGAGVSLIYAEVETLQGGALVEDDDVVFAGYARAGVLVQIDAARHIGFDVRGIFPQDADIGAEEVDLGSVVISLVFGAHF